MTNFILQIKIKLFVKKSTNKIQLHAVDLDVWKNSTAVYRGVFMKSDYAESVKLARQYYDSSNQVYVIETENSLEFFCTYWLELKFTGKLNDQPRGFYRSSYIVDNEIRFLFLFKNWIILYFHDIFGKKINFNLLLSNLQG